MFFYIFEGQQLELLWSYSTVLEHVARSANVLKLSTSVGIS